MKFDVIDYPNDRGSYSYAMSCDTEEKAIVFLDYLHSVGRRWNGGTNYDRLRNFNRYGKATVYFFNDGLYGADTSLPKNTTLLYFDDFNWSDTDSLPVPFEDFFNGTLE